ncbi:MAG: hypothetical protein HWE10_09635 [Gammaproteobacteria bacterium]|nr:hypothetical protein [Gammaproteobacteria bacterium]
MVKVTQALKQKKHFSDLSVNDEELAGRRPVRLQSENTEIQGCASTQSETTDKHSKHGQHFEIKGIITAVDHAVVLLQGPSEMLSISSEIRKTNQTLLANRSESTGVQPQDKTVFINDESVTVYFQGCRLEFNF